MPVLGGVINFAHFISGHEQTQLNRVCYLRFFNMVLVFEGSNKSKLIFQRLLLIRRGGRVERWCWVNFQCRGVLQFGLQ